MNNTTKKQLYFLGATLIVVGLLVSGIESIHYVKKDSGKKTPRISYNAEVISLDREPDGDFMTFDTDDMEAFIKAVSTECPQGQTKSMHYRFPQKGETAKDPRWFLVKCSKQ